MIMNERQKVAHSEITSCFIKLNNYKFNIKATLASDFFYIHPLFIL